MAIPPGRQLNLLRGFLIALGLVLSFFLVQWLWKVPDLAVPLKIIAALFGIWLIAVVLSVLGEHGARWINSDSE